MKKPKQTNRALSEHERSKLAARAVYTGSVEHKNQKSWLGLPRHRHHESIETAGYEQNATLCPLVTDADRAKADAWVKNAIRNGQYNNDIWDGDFPRNIWHREGPDSFWFGRLTQRGTGGDTAAEYKGWPTDWKEWHENFG
jgi:hypothetical protein